MQSHDLISSSKDAVTQHHKDRISVLTYIHNKALLTLLFWRFVNFATSQMSVKNKATETPQGMYCIHAHYIAMHFFVCSGIRLSHTYTSTWGFQRCTLKDDISYLLPTWLSAGTGKLKRKHYFIGWQERTNKMKNKSCATNFATQQPFSLLLLFQEPFLLAERKKMCYLSMAANQSQYTNINSFILGYIY